MPINGNDQNQFIGSQDIIMQDFAAPNQPEGNEPNPVWNSPDTESRNDGFAGCFPRYVFPLYKPYIITVFCVTVIVSILFISVYFSLNEMNPHCVQKLWSMDLKQTEITSELMIDQNIIFTYKQDQEEGVQCINSSSGESLYKTKEISPIYFDAANGSFVVMDENGLLRLFNSSDGNEIWSLHDENELVNFPIILPDCDGNGVSEVVGVIFNLVLKFLFDPVTYRYITVSNCTHYPTSLMPWTSHNETDLLVICEEVDQDLVVKIPKSTWCHFKGEDRVASAKQTLIISVKGQFSNETKLLATPEGHYIWGYDLLIFFSNSDEDHLHWNILLTNHSLENRFLVYGTLDKNNPTTDQVILCSSTWNNTFQITMLNANNGSITNGDVFPNMRVEHVEVLHGENEDFLLVLKKIYPLNSKKVLREEVGLIRLSGQSVVTFSSLTYEGEESKTFLKVLRNDQNEDYTSKIILAREFSGNASSTKIYCFSLNLSVSPCM